MKDDIKIENLDSNDSSEKIIFEEPKHHKRKVVISIIMTILLVIILLLSTCVIAPPYFLKALNKINNPSSYKRNFIFSLTPSSDTSNIPKLAFNISLAENKNVTETYQIIDGNIDDKEFYWQKLYKFNTLIIKTPYDSRYFKIDNFSKYGYYHTFAYPGMMTLDPINSFLISKGDMGHINANIEKKVLFKDKKMNFIYELKPDKNESQILFKNLTNKIYNNKNFNSFFKEDNGIQNKLKLKNNTKELINVFYNIKSNATVNSSDITVAADFTKINNITYNFDITMKDQNDNDFNLNFMLSESMEPTDKNKSPEKELDSVSFTDINDISKKVAATSDKTKNN